MVSDKTSTFVKSGLGHIACTYPRECTSIIMSEWTVQLLCVFHCTTGNDIFTNYVVKKLIKFCFSLHYKKLCILELHCKNISINIMLNVSYSASYQ